MRIGVNYRLGLNPVSGIPLTIKYLYSTLPQLDPHHTYLHFQPPPYIPSLIFDTLVCSWLIYRHPVDVFHGPSFILPWWKPKNTKFVVTIHDLAFLARPKVATPWFRFFYKFITSHSLSLADLVISVSENTKLDLVKYFGVPPDKIIVIPNGISQTYLFAHPQPKIISGDYLLTMTTHPIRKNTPLLIQAFSQLPLKYRFRLVIAGNMGQSYQNQLQKLVHDAHLSDQVIFPGPISENKLASLYQHAQLFVYPSTYEGFGLPVLEAMASGCLVLAANTSSLPEIVPDPRCLFSPLTGEALTKALERLLSLTPLQKTQLIQKNRQFASRYSWKNTAEKYLSIFSQINHKYFYISHSPS